jgi:riboflavin transporter
MNPVSGPLRYAVLWLRIFYGVHLTYSGLRFVMFNEIPATADATGQLVAAMSAIGLYQAIKWIETIVGFCLLANIAVPLALVIEFPITVTIFYLNTFVAASGRQLFSGPQELFLNAALMIAYGGYYARMLRVAAPAVPLWRAVDEIREDNTP